MVCPNELKKWPNKQDRRENREMIGSGKRGHHITNAPELGYSYSKRYVENLIFGFQIFRTEQKQKD